MKKALLLFVVLLTSYTTSAASLVSNMNDWVSAQLSTDGTSLLSFVFLLIGGLAASLLPCVYPLYPITINILKARGNNEKKALHPIAYFLGMISMYLVFGIIAGTTGGAFNEVLRYPFTNLLIAVVLILLGLSSAELLHIPLFSGSGRDTNKKGALGTYLMGISAGLLSSACVGPVVVSILIGIASNTTGISFASVVGASLKLLVFGIGVGMPFLLIGVVGAKLPKSGGWMKYVQYAFAALIIYFAYGYLEKALLGFGFEERSIIGIAFGTFVLLMGVYHLQKKELMPHQKMRTALFTLAAIMGGLILMRSFTTGPSGGTEPLAVAAAIEKKGNLEWYTDKDAAYSEAKKNGKLVFLDFHGNWCTNCKAFQELTQEDTELNTALQNAVLYKVYDTSEEFKVYQNDPRFPELKVGLPFLVITDTEGNLLYKTNDYQKSDEIAMFLSE